MSRRFPVLGFILAVLCFSFAMAASAGDANLGKLRGETRFSVICGYLIPVTRVTPESVGDTRAFAPAFERAALARDFGRVAAMSSLKTIANGDVYPGVVIYGLGGPSHWKCAIKITAPLDAEVDFDASNGLVIGPNAGHLVVPKGGARTIFYDELRGYMSPTVSDLGIMPSAPAIAVTSFLWFDDGHSQTSFGSGALLQTITSDKELFRFSDAINAKTTPLGEIDTNVALFNTGAQINSVMCVSYDASGVPLSAIEIIVPPHGIVQQQVSGDFKSGTVQLFRGCNFGPCQLSDAPLYFLATSGPPTGGTVDTLRAQNIGSE